MEWFIEYVLPMITTVISGVIVYLIGQYFHVIWLNPLQEYKRIRAEIARQLLLYANVYTNVIGYDEECESRKEKHIDVSNELRKLAASLEGYIQTLYWFKIGIPSKKKLSKVVSSLVFLSSSCFVDYTPHQNQSNRNEANAIRKLLKIYQYNAK